MQPSQIALFRQSFLQLVPEADMLTDLFYARLFQLDPSMRALFPVNLYTQKGKLMHILALMARSVELPDRWLPQIQQLGRRHAQYQLQARHYETFGAALLWTLETGLGEEFTPELRAAWSAFYDELALAMQNACQCPI